MVKAQQSRRLAVVLVALGITAGTSVPVALAAGGDGTISGGGGPNPEAEQMSRDRGWVVPFAPLHFGAEPYAAVESAASSAASDAGCSISATAATHLTLAPTWPEVAPSGESPSPMTLSRYDDQTSLADPEQRAEGLFFNPGVGIWQLDSAGLGAEETAATAIDSSSAAATMAPHMVDEYCSAIDGGSSEAEARAAAWRPWHACDSGACEDVYQRLSSDGVTKDDEVDRYGGAEMRECTFEGATYDCLYVDPSAAQGEDAWTSPDYGPAPLPSPFYAFTYSEGGVDHEVRYWLKGDSGASTDVSASRELGVDARSKLSWAEESSLCDTTAGRGNC
ncbi:hypothetical protein EIL87_23125 [Saccharopolyspora rhizosphaerae]|uniref:Uncharacterized protein n=1 Tax=Saccharopolyspora rhizosphaerae TaxID=2492662 RepID=A0A426JHL0_9PSEU|nr:hypothetical protein [Saccharopolyspora rhizosphaerae]RRO12607.1 hypothetical protein EIL87_23125 [Saccharopolyspora rhizosphaerae]